MQNETYPGNMVERAVAFKMRYGTATIQLLRGKKGGMDVAMRLWNGLWQERFNVPKYPAYAGRVEAAYERMVKAEERNAAAYPVTAPAPEATTKVSAPEKSGV